MFPLLLIAAIAAYALSQDKKGKGSSSGGSSPSPAPGTGGGIAGGGPLVIGTAPASSQAPLVCDFDMSIPPAVKDQAMALLNQAQTADAAVAGPLATSLDTMAATLEMSGLPKTASCLRERAKYLRSKYQPAGSPGTQILQAGSSLVSPLLVNVLPKPKA